MWRSYSHEKGTGGLLCIAASARQGQSISIVGVIGNEQRKMGCKSGCRLLRSGCHDFRARVCY
jgi:hypothetical protein